MPQSQGSAIESFRRYRKNTLASLVVSGFVAVLVNGCGKGAPPPFVMPPPAVSTVPVTTANVPIYLDEIGKTIATEVVNVLPQVSGIIVDGPPHTFVDGADVKKDQLLFQIDPRPFEAQVAAAKAALEQNRAQLDLATKNFNRIVELMPTKAVAQADYDTAKGGVDVANANVNASLAALQTANLNLEYCTIKSPLDGRAGQRMVDVGNVISGIGALGTGASLLLGIQKIDPIYVDFTVSETDLEHVRQNMNRVVNDLNPDNRFLAVEVQNPNLDGKPILGKLTFLDNQVQDGTGTIKLRATVENHERLLWPGQFVRVRLVLQVKQDAMLVPAEAVQIGQTGPFVFVVEPGNIATQQNVTEGQRQGDMVVIETGLSAGQTVIRTGQLTVLPGKPVNPTASTQPATAPSGAH